MLLLAKVALGIGSTMVVAGAYTFHEGVIRVDVDEHRDNGSHIHFWVPAAVVPLALHIAPRREMERAAREAGPYMPMLRTLTKELEKYPDVTFVEVTEPGQIADRRGRFGQHGAHRVPAGSDRGCRGPTGITSPGRLGTLRNLHRARAITPLALPWPG
jgi:hypothetical protein